MSESFGTIALALGRLAAGRLGWRPDEFWRATPAELLALLVPATDDQAQPLDRTTLQRMMEQDYG
jgi:uncharacterized phage protein (TIGR02216 family)